MNDLQLDMLKKLLEASEQARSKLEEMRDELRHLDKKLELHVQKNDYQTDQLKKIDETQGEILKEYKKRTEELEEELENLSIKFTSKLEELESKASEFKEIEEKVKTLEKPQEFLKTLGSVILVIASILGALYTIYEFIIKTKG